MVVYIIEWTFPKCDVVSACLLIQHIKTYLTYIYIHIRMCCKYRCSLYMHDINNNHIYCNPAEKKTQIVCPFFQSQPSPSVTGRPGHQLSTWKFQLYQSQKYPEKYCLPKVHPGWWMPTGFLFRCKVAKMIWTPTTTQLLRRAEQKFHQEEVNCLPVCPISQCVHAEYVVYRKKYSLDKNIW